MDEDSFDPWAIVTLLALIEAFVYGFGLGALVV